jgi:hypothetical protein
MRITIEFDYDPSANLKPYEAKAYVTMHGGMEWTYAHSAVSWEEAEQLLLEKIRYRLRKPPNKEVVVEDEG